MAKLLVTEYYNEIYSDRHFIVCWRTKISPLQIECWEKLLDNTTISYKKTTCLREMFPKNHLRFRSNLHWIRTLLNLAA